MIARALLLASLFVLGCGGRTDETIGAVAGSETGPGAGSDAGSETGPAPPPAILASGQQVVFEADYQNWAWGYACSGIYVTADGTVRAYSCEEAAAKDARRRPGMTAEELLASYGATKVVGTVPVAELTAKFGLVSSAEKGALTAESLCADAGDRTFRAFRFDSSKKTYSPITLGAHGDRAVLNSEPAAGTLVDWLASLAGFGRDSCAPMARLACAGCKVAACEKDWQTPTCDGACVSATRCESVPSCAACGTSAACVLDGAGRAHCTSGGCSPTNCACAGDTLCASGKAWCKGSAAEGFRCEQP